jgi:hypothetical protein
MKNLIVLLFLLSLAFVSFGQIDYTARSGSEVHSVQMSMVDTAWLDTTGTDTGDTVLYAIYAPPFSKYTKFATRLTRLTGSYTKVNVKLYSTLAYSSDITKWTLKQTVAYADTLTTYDLTSALDTTFAQYIMLQVAPIDSMQTLRIRHSVLIDSK